VEVLDGRAPRGPSEVALSAEAVQRLGQAIGGTVTTGDGAHSFTVVGLVEFPSLLEQVTLFAPDAAGALGSTELDRTWLVDTPAPLDWDAVRELNRSGIAVASRAVFADLPPDTDVAQSSAPRLALGVVVAGLALLEVILLAGPAFAVGARRRQRQLALVAANGGTPAHVRRIVLADGVVLGLTGAAVGITLGIVAAFVVRPYLEEWLNARAGGYRVFPVALGVIAGLAVVIGLLAAVVPAFITARQDVVAALAGRRGAIRSRKRWLLLGIGMTAAGTVLVAMGTFAINANVMLAGLVVGELGLVLCTPTLVGLIARLGRLVPLAPRVALRDAARNRAAAAPALSAVMAAVAGSVAIGLFYASQQAAYTREATTALPVGTLTVSLAVGGPGERSADPVAVETAIRAVLPVTAFHRLTTVACPPGDGSNRLCGMNVVMPAERRCPYDETVLVGTRELTRDEMRAARGDPRCDDPYAHQGLTQPYVDDGPALAALTDASPEDVAAATAMLRSGGVVVHDARYVKDGRVTVAMINVDPSGTDGPLQWVDKAPRMSFPAYTLTSGNPGTPAIVAPAVVAGAGLGTRSDTVIVDTTRAPTQAEVDRLRLRLEPLLASVNVEQGVAQDLNLMLWVLAGAAGLITIGAAGIATGLAAADGRADLSTLAAVGASPRLRRGLSLSQSGVIAGLGSLLGALAGMGAAIAILVALNQRYAEIWPGPPMMPILVPWSSLAVSLLVVPLIAMLGAGLLTRSRLPIERRI
jgi:putative ABC transport system permease protein